MYIPYTFHVSVDVKTLYLFLWFMAISCGKAVHLAWLQPPVDLKWFLGCLARLSGLWDGRSRPIVQAIASGCEDFPAILQVQDEDKQNPSILPSPSNLQHQQQQQQQDMLPWQPKTYKDCSWETMEAANSRSSPFIASHQILTTISKRFVQLLYICKYLVKRLLRKC